MTHVVLLHDRTVCQSSLKSCAGANAFQFVSLDMSVDPGLAVAELRSLTQRNVLISFSIDMGTRTTIEPSLAARMSTIDTCLHHALVDAMKRTPNMIVIFHGRGAVKSYKLLPLIKHALGLPTVVKARSLGPVPPSNPGCPSNRVRTDYMQCCTDTRIAVDRCCAIAKSRRGVPIVVSLDDIEKCYSGEGSSSKSPAQGLAESIVGAIDVSRVTSLHIDRRFSRPSSTFEPEFDPERGVVVVTDLDDGFGDTLMGSDDSTSVRSGLRYLRDALEILRPYYVEVVFISRLEWDSIRNALNWGFDVSSSKVPSLPPHVSKERVVQSLGHWGVSMPHTRNEAEELYCARFAGPEFLLQSLRTTVQSFASAGGCSLVKLLHMHGSLVYHDAFELAMREYLAPFRLKVIQARKIVDWIETGRLLQPLDEDEQRFCDFVGLVEGVICPPLIRRALESWMPMSNKIEVEFVRSLEGDTDSTLASGKRLEHAWESGLVRGSLRYYFMIFFKGFNVTINPLSTVELATLSGYEGSLRWCQAQFPAVSYRPMEMESIKTGYAKTDHQFYHD